MRRTWFIAAIVVGVVAIAIAAIAMRLSDNGSGNPSTAEWASSVCSDLATWKSSISALADVSGGTLDAETLKQKIDDAQTATSTLVSELDALGPPDLEAGDQLQQELSASADQLQSSFDALQQGAQQASQASSPSAFLKSLGALAPQFQQLLEAAQNTVQTLENANVAENAKSELQAAFAGAQSCQDLKSNG